MMDRIRIPARAIKLSRGLFGGGEARFALGRNDFKRMGELQDQGAVITITTAMGSLSEKGKRASRNWMTFQLKPQERDRLIGDVAGRVFMEMAMMGQPGAHKTDAMIAVNEIMARVLERLGDEPSYYSKRVDHAIQHITNRVVDRAFGRVLARGARQRVDPSTDKMSPLGDTTPPEADTTKPGGDEPPTRWQVVSARGRIAETFDNEGDARKDAEERNEKRGAWRVIPSGRRAYDKK